MSGKAIEAEPTAAQVTAGAKVLRDDGYPADCYRAARMVYAAMLSARPQPKD